MAFTTWGSILVAVSSVLGATGGALVGLSPTGMVASTAGGALLALGGAVGVGRARRQQLRQRVVSLTTAVRDLDVNAGELADLGLDDDPDVLAALVKAIEALHTRAQEQVYDLRSQGDVLRSLLESSPSGVLITNRAGLIRYLNPTFEKLVRLRGDPIGQEPIVAVPVAEVQTAVTRALAGQSSTDVPCTSDPYELLLQAAPIPDGGALVLAQDVTQFRLAERARTDFVANVSHELRTPLTAILGFAEALLDDRDDLPDDAVQLLERVHRNARRLRDLFEDLLTLSRIEARRGELPITDSPLRPILAEALASAADLAHERGQSFELRCKRSRAARVNPEALATIVSNLVVNACHYTPEGGAITVSVHDEGDQVRIDVVDDGIGIDPAHHQRIFERFYRVDEGRSRRKGGTGLGLAIVKHMALASGARISLSSEHGKGSTFSLHIPR